MNKLTNFLSWLLLCSFIVGCGGGNSPTYTKVETIPSPVSVSNFSYNMGTGNPPESFKGWALIKRHGTYDSVFNNGEVYSSIDTRTFPYQTIVGGGPQSILSNNLETEIPVFSEDGDLAFEFKAKVIASDVTGVGQLVWVAYLTDGSNVFAMIFNLWDNRYSSFTPNVMNDTTTPFINSPFETNKYATLYENSSSMSNDIHSEFREYKITFTKQNFQNMINDLNSYCGNSMFCTRFSEDVNDYKLGLYGILHEVFLLDNPGLYVNHTVVYKDLVVYRIKYD